MARPQKNRKICSPPLMKGFKPYGIRLCKTETIRLSFEQYESIRLVNYEMLSQEQAAKRMNISRPTLTRVYNKAIKIIAKALIEGKAVEIEGGNYQLEQDWWRCKKCYKLIQGIDNHIKCKNCLLYSENELINLNQSKIND
ncbi:MAG: DUF134 domain-containing protein [Bacteroidia bacterium]|nr:DUF134 domain-containing protein [Bacteroidia bacterium]